MTTSVALCTYNGGRFLAEQLASVAAQTRPPDEVVVCDDASADDSAAVARAFAAAAPFPVRVEVNPTTLGTAANFERAIRLCTGDVIALCDQDDVWRPDKLAVLGAALAADPAAGLAFSDAALVDEARRPLGGSLWGAIEFGPAERRAFAAGRAFDCLLRRPRVTGATAAFRASLRELALPIPPGWLHDAWVALVAAAVGPVVPVAEKLIEYRQHPRQQVGGRRRGWLAQYRTAREMGRAEFRAVAGRFAAALGRLAGRPEVPAEKLRLLAAKVAHAEARAGMRAGGWRLPAVVREWRRGNYARFGRGWKAAAQDLFLP